jgi:GTP-binding protein
MFTIVITGRPNVGKSTLFNKLAKKQLAIIDDTPGVTRDWRESYATISGEKVKIIDTAGLEEEFDDSIRGRMRQQTELALEQADIILFMVDGKSGITPLDEHFASWLRKKSLPVLLVVNKCENERATQHAIAESFSLGLGNPIPISAAHSVGLAELTHYIEPLLPEDDLDEYQEDDSSEMNLEEESEIDNLEGSDKEYFFEEEDETAPIKIAIIGRPNVGKSTLVNSLLKEQRVMTGPEAGITRDAIAIEWLYKDRKFKLIDTAGIRKKSKITDQIEKMSVEDSIRAIRLAQIVILVLDANQALEKQDLQLAEHVINEGRALIIAFNKWDTIKNKNETLEELNYKLDKSLSQVKDISYQCISALNMKNLDKLMNHALRTYGIWNKRIATGSLNRWLSYMEQQHPAPLTHGKQNRLKYIAQIKSRPPTFILWVSRPKELPATYKRYIVNGLREEYKLPGVPLRLLIRTSKNPYS